MQSCCKSYSKVSHKGLNVKLVKAFIVFFANLTQKSPENGMILEILTKVFCVLTVFFCLILIANLAFFQLH